MIANKNSEAAEYRVAESVSPYLPPAPPARTLPHLLFRLVIHALFLQRAFPSGSLSLTVAQIIRDYSTLADVGLLNVMLNTII